MVDSRGYSNTVWDVKLTVLHILDEKLESLGWESAFLFAMKMPILPYFHRVAWTLQLECVLVFSVFSRTIRSATVAFIGTFECKSWKNSQQTHDISEIQPENGGLILAGCQFCRLEIWWWKKCHG